MSTTIRIIESQALEGTSGDHGVCTDTVRTFPPKHLEHMVYQYVLLHDYSFTEREHTREAVFVPV